MTKPFFPDYENCYVNMISSVAKSFGVDTGHTTLEKVDKLLKRKTKNVVIVLLDGMGKAILERNLPEKSFLRKHVLQNITSVFPPTTTTGTMCYKTGLMPIQHGWLSLFLFLKEVGSSVNLYLNTDAFSKKPLSKPHIADDVLGFSNIFERIEEQTKGRVKAYGVSVKEARDLFGNITQITYDDFHEMCMSIKTLCSLEGKKVIYAYHNHPDNTMHKFGPYSPEASEKLIEFDAELENLTKNCPDTTFLICADHGQTYVEKVFDLSAFPDLDNTFLMPPTGGPRAFCVFVKNGKRQEFKRLAKKYLGDEFLILSKNQILEMKLFGTGTPHPKIDDLLGDFWIISTGKSNLAYTTLYHLPVKEPLGAHGGLTKEEVELSLIAFKNAKKQKS